MRGVRTIKGLGPLTCFFQWNVLPVVVKALIFEKVIFSVIYATQTVCVVGPNHASKGSSFNRLHNLHKNICLYTCSTV